MTANRVTTRVRVVAALIATLVMAGCSGSGIGSTGSQSVFHLKPGTCVVPPSNIKAEITDLKTVKCTVPHTQEVYAGVLDPTTDSNYPGAQVLSTFANANCIQQFKAYTGIDYRDSPYFFTYLLPSVRSWAASDRCVVCLVIGTQGPITHSVAAPGSPPKMPTCDKSSTAGKQEG